MQELKLFLSQDCGLSMHADCTSASRKFSWILESFHIRFVDCEWLCTCVCVCAREYTTACMFESVCEYTRVSNGVLLDKARDAS